MSEPSISDIEKLNGKDFKLLTESEKKIYYFFVLQGARFNVMVDSTLAIPENELERARFMKLSFSERNKRYPEIIEVETSNP